MNSISIKNRQGYLKSQQKNQLDELNNEKYNANSYK